MKRILTLVLCFIIVANFVIPARVEDNEDILVEITVENFDQISFAEDAYSALNDDAKAIFEYEIAN